MKTIRLLAWAVLALAGAANAQSSNKAELESVQRAVHVCAACHGDYGRSSKSFEIGRAHV